jgi:serine/threonine protein kinase
MVANPSYADRRSFLDRLCSAGCIMTDLESHVTLLTDMTAVTALPEKVRLVRPTSSRTAADADIVALKVASEEIEMSQLTNEVQFLLNLHHDGIVRAYGIYLVKCEGTRSLGMLLDYKKDGDLASMITNDGLPERMLRGIMAQVCSAMVYIHKLNVVHRDIKPSNVLCERAKDGSLKFFLVEFGMAALIMDTNKISISCGSVGYIAPEVLQKEWKTKARTETATNITKIDVFSLGMLMYTTAVGYNPFCEDTESSISYALALKRNTRGLLSIENMAGPSDELKSLLSGLCASDPRLRLASSEALSHPWLSDHGVSRTNGYCNYAEIRRPHSQ